MKIAVSITPELLKRLDDRAAKEDRKRSAVIKRAVETYLKRK